ncbi:MAG: DNA repair protein RadC [Bacteroidota bacterium]
MSLPINRWSVQDRPREKFYSRGRKSLTDAELLAIIIGNGTKNASALQIAHSILENNRYSLEEIRKLELQQLMRIRGVGKAKAIAILSALELSNRVEKQANDKIKITESKIAFDLLKSSFQDLKHEEFYVIFLNNSHIVLDYKCVSKGGITATIADGRIIFKEAILRDSTSIILAHNHPSGNAQPSNSDINLTKNLKEFGKCVDIKVLDHIIVADNLYFSFVDNGMI